MQNKILTVIGTTLITSLLAGPAQANNYNSAHDYARVVHVEPKYHYITVQKPQRHCSYVAPSRGHNRNHNQHNHNNNNHNNGNRNQRPRRDQRRFIRGETLFNTSIDTGGAALIGGVIGGAIGHRLSGSINGRSDPAVTLAGAAIGSVLAHNATSSNFHRVSNKNHDHNTIYVNNNQRYDHNGNQRHNNHNHYNNRNNHNRNHRNNRRVERCVTTTVSHRERRLNGYRVTYVYRGNTFNTITDYHPGDRIKVNVQVRPH